MEYPSFRIFTNTNIIYVPACRSVTTNHCRVVFVESSTIRTDQEGPETKGSQPRALKKIEHLPYDSGGEGLVQFGISRIPIPARLHPAKLSNGENLVSSRNLCRTPPAKSRDQHAFLVEVPTVLVATFRRTKECRTHILKTVPSCSYPEDGGLNQHVVVVESPISSTAPQPVDKVSELSTSVFAWEQEMTHCRKPSILSVYPSELRPRFLSFYSTSLHARWLWERSKKS